MVSFIDTASQETESYPYFVLELFLRVSCDCLQNSGAFSCPTPKNNDIGFNYSEIKDTIFFHKEKTSLLTRLVRTTADRLTIADHSPLAWTSQNQSGV
jgi:hypothetical protein